MTPPRLPFARPLALGLALLCIGGRAGAADAPEITQAACAQCHGSNGVATAPATPHLNGQLAHYLADTMAKFQQGRRSSSVPNHIPATLTAADLDAIAKYYATVKATRPKQTTDPDKVVRGNNIYFSRCADCHAETGRVGEDDAPVMTAQNLQHLITQTKAFTTGERKFVSLMRDAYRGLTDDDLEAIAHFLAAQEPVVDKKKKRR